MTTQTDTLAEHLNALSNIPAALPLEQWSPQFCGKMDLTIDAAGQWWHEGARMTRQSLINLFAKVLWREEDANGNRQHDRFFLKTPVEKIEIHVADVPLIITQFDYILPTQAGHAPTIYLTAQTGEYFAIDAEHIPFMRNYQGEWRPYVRVRRNLEARIERHVFYQWSELGQWFDEAGQTGFRLQSGNLSFTLAIPTP